VTEIRLSVVAPFYNEADGLRAFAEELRSACDALNLPYEVIMVNDGSTDGSLDALRDMSWPEGSVLDLVTNVGHQNAFDAGLRSSRGEWVVTMDADGQHPPSMIGVLLNAALAGDHEVVNAVAASRRKDGWFKRNSARAYYALMKMGSQVNFVENAADFRLMKRNVVDVLNQIQEEKVFRLLVPSLGFRSTHVMYDVKERNFGTSKYTLRKMLRLAVSSLLSHSHLPLRWVTILGLATAGLAFSLLGFALLNYLLGNNVQGWTSVMVAVLLFGGVQLIALGVIGEYIIGLQKVVRQRPIFIVRGRRHLLGSSTPGQ